MTTEPLVSVITPTYNRADFLPKAVESVLEQTYPNLELFIVDDGSTDNTKQVLEPYLQDRRVKYLYQQNQGQSVARNLGLAQAGGEYICFLDSDNAWALHKTEASLRAFRENAEADVVYGDTITINEDGDEISRKNMKRYSGRIVPYMLRDNCVSMNTAMARRKCFDEHGRMSAQSRVADDYDLWLRFSAYYQFLYIPDYLAYYRVMENQISSDKTARYASNKAILERFLQAHGPKVTRKEANMGWYSFYTRKGGYHARSGEPGAAFGCFLRAIARRPASYPAWAGLLKLLMPGR